MSRDNNIDNFEVENFSNKIDKKLIEDEASDLEGEITMHEINNCLRNMKNNKSPGSDGFSVEFF